MLVSVLISNLFFKLFLLGVGFLSGFRSIQSLVPPRMQLQQMMSFTIVPIACIGIFCNWSVVIGIWKNRSLSHSFSLLTANQAIFNGLHSTLFLFYVFPMIALDSQIMLYNSTHCGFLLMVFYDVSIQAHFLITINRFCAVFLPIIYKNLFSARATKLIIFLSFLVSLSILSLFFQFLPCRIYYDSVNWGFTYTDIPVCHAYGNIGDAGKLMTMCIFNFVVDTVTLWKVRKARQMVRRGQGPNPFQKKEMDFLVQSFGQAMFLMICLPSYYVVPMLTESKVLLFLMGTVFWCTLHALDGVFTLCFNSEIRRSLFVYQKQHGPSGANSFMIIDGKSSVRI